MKLLPVCVLVGLCIVPLPSQGGGAVKKGEPVWARIVADLFTAEMNQKALAEEKNALVGPDSELRFDLQKLGAGNKFSLKAIRQKYGPPARIEQFAVQVDGKVVSYVELHYPPISFSAPADSDQAQTLAAPTKLWTGPGILEHAKKALKGK